MVDDIGDTNYTKVVKISDKQPTLMDEFQQWLEELVFPGKVEDFIQEVSGYGSDEEVNRKIVFYTDEHEYYITAIERKKGDGYLGCGVLARKNRAGEDWARGNDLPDGPFNKETWNRIVYAIVNYELVKLTPYKKPDSIPNGIA